MDQDLVTYRTRPADPVRERARLWRAQILLGAAVAAGTVGMVWLAIEMGGGPGTAAAVLVAGLAPVAVGTVPAARLACRVRRRALLVAGPAGAALALAAASLGGPVGGTALLVAAALVAAAGRSAFDGAAADVLHQLVEAHRTPTAVRQLAARYGMGQPIGLAGALVAGLAVGPRGAVALASLLAAAGAAVAAGHHRDIDLRVPGAVPLTAALRAGARAARRERALADTLMAGAWGVAIGLAQAAVLIAWLREGVGLDRALSPALLAGLAALTLAHPLLARLSRTARSRTVLTVALCLQAAGSLTAYAAGDVAGAAAAYALGLGGGACLAALVTRVQGEVGPPELAPALGLAGGVAWAVAGCAGAALGAALAPALGLADTHLVLSATAPASAIALATRLDRPGRAALRLAAAAGGRRGSG